MSNAAAVQKLVTDVVERYHALSLRERVLVGLALFSATWMVWSASLGGWLEESEEQISRDIDVLYTQLEAEVAEQSRLQRAKANDPNAKLARERQVLAAELSALNESMSAVLDRFVPPERMPELLRQVIRHHDGLRLKKMERLPVEPIMLTDIVDQPEAVEEEARKNEKPVMYLHPMRLEFEGNYFQVLAYLAELEESDWDLGWRRLSYVVTAYPDADIAIEIETLSRDRSWIGV